MQEVTFSRRHEVLELGIEYALFKLAALKTQQVQKWYTFEICRWHSRLVLLLLQQQSLKQRNLIRRISETVSVLLFFYLLLYISMGVAEGRMA